MGGVLARRIAGGQSCARRRCVRESKMTRCARGPCRTRAILHGGQERLNDLGGLGFLACHCDQRARETQSAQLALCTQKCAQSALDHVYVRLIIYIYTYTHTMCKLERGSYV